jgi:predicted dehydrogenase
MKQANSSLRVLILGTGGMARVHAESFKKIPGVEVVAGVDMRADALDVFCDTHGIEHRFTSLEAAIEWGGFDAASNVTPDSVHYATTLTLLAAGKHVLCEKPLSTDFGRASEMADAARAAGVVNMVNLSYRNFAATQKAAEMIRAGALGTIRHFEANYLQSWLTQSKWGDWRTESKWLWRLSKRHGSKGVLGDVGIHIIDFATYIADSLPVDVSSRLKTFSKAPGDKIGEYDLDANDSFVMHAELADGAIGTITATRFASGHHNDLTLRIYGDLGGMEVALIKDKGHLRVCLGEDMLTEEWRDVPLDPVLNMYERFAAACMGKGPMEPDFGRGAALQRILDLAEDSSIAGGLSMQVGEEALALDGDASVEAVTEPSRAQNG